MKRVCPEGHHLCMKNISVDEIQEAVLQKLSALKKAMIRIKRHGNIVINS